MFELSPSDVRPGLAVVGSFKGNAGSVRSVSLHPTLPLVAAVGMDRHLRIYHIGTQKVLKKVRAHLGAVRLLRKFE